MWAILLMEVARAAVVAPSESSRLFVTHLEVARVGVVVEREENQPSVPSFHRDYKRPHNLEVG